MLSLTNGFLLSSSRNKTNSSQFTALLKGESRNLGAEENFTRNFFYSVCLTEKPDCQDSALNTETFAFPKGTGKMHSGSIS